MKAFETKTELLPYQFDAVAKVLPARVNALFMDMGTGKTRTTIELVRIRHKKIDKVVWCCPKALMTTVFYELLKHTNCTAEEDIYVFDRRTTQRRIPRDRAWYIVAIESLSSSRRVTLALNSIITEDSYVIMDESSYIKGHSALRTQRITLMAERCRYRTILTGTAISQGIVDLYAQMAFLSPKILDYKTFSTFAANHLEYSDAFPGMIVRSHNIPFLAEKIKPYVYQCRKEECLELPEKLFSRRCLQLSDEQRVAYETAKDEYAEKMNEILDRGDTHKLSVLIFALFTALQSIICGFWNHRNKEGKMVFETLENYRPDMAMNVLRSIPDKEAKVIIWCKYHYALKELNDRICAEFGAGKVAQFHGKVPVARRVAEQERFENRARFLLATQGCGGHGLNLQFCHYQLFYANSFKYSERLQAEDRCHRHGQEYPVTYIDLHTLGTIDDKIGDALDTKGNALQSFRTQIEKVKKDKKRSKIVEDLIRSL